MTSPARVGAAALLCLLLCVGCKATANVAIDVTADGSGTVTVTLDLDAEAAKELGDVTSVVRLDGLREAGWKVTGPASDGGAVEMRASKAFATAARLGPVLDEIGGADGPFRDWKLVTTNEFTSATYRVTGAVELSGDLAQFSDRDVAAALDGLALGRTPDELKAALADHPDALALAVEVRLPGELDEVTGLTSKDPGTPVASRTFLLGKGERADVNLVVASSDDDRSSVLWLLIGAGLVVAAVAVLVVGRRRRPAPASQG